MLAKNKVRPAGARAHSRVRMVASSLARSGGLGEHAEPAGSGRSRPRGERENPLGTLLALPALPLVY